MDYSFIRKIVSSIPAEDARALYKIFTSNGLEVFVKKDNGYHNMALEELSEKVDVYVSAADFEYAKRLLVDIGMNDFLCSDLEAITNSAKSDIELAEDEFYRKHKQNQMFALGVIILVILFLIFQFINA